MRGAKRSCRQYSKNIDDLPDFILVDILRRLPCESAVQCKCVSKHWSGLISDPFFLRRFLCLQSYKQKPIIRTLIFSDTQIKRKFFSMSSSPEPRTDNWPDFSFLPCFQAPSVIKENQPVVLGAYNDLVLCCATRYFQHDYYICNPCTKKWVRLPPAPGSFQKLRVGFTCEPFYKKVVGEKEEESIFQLDFEYSYNVVRIICPYPEESTSFQFGLQVFSSETRRWVHSTVRSPQRFNFDTLAQNIGIAYKGMLYWWSLDGFIIELDLSSNHWSFFCRFIDKPRDDQIGGAFDFLGVCRGRMRLCQLFALRDQYGVTECFLRIWELREDQVDKIHDRWCLIDTLSIEQMIYENPSMSDWEFKLVENDMIKMTVLAFDPNNEDIVFLVVSQHIFMCNIRAKTLTETNITPYKSTCCFDRSVFPLVLPWWPTPVPRVTGNAAPAGDLRSGSHEFNRWPFAIRIATFSDLVR